MTPSDNAQDTKTPDLTAVVPSKPPPEEWESLITRVLDTILGRHFGGGYDFFISYAWKDGRSYALRLRDELKQRGFRSFLDSEDYEKGTSWKREGRRALKRTNRLLLVITEGAMNSGPVKREIELFHGLGRPVWPINIANVWASVGTAEIRDKIAEDILRFEEPGVAEEILTRGPSDVVLHDIVNSFDLRR